jgi:hypothetical protein
MLRRVELVRLKIPAGGSALGLALPPEFLVQMQLQAHIWKISVYKENYEWEKI